ncbi:MAG: hypothetical protein C0179_04030 [Fervidicoccus sp.]|nr:MAG: hypothetical protein C0179_04030 [Fervidicoccus sp.]
MSERERSVISILVRLINFISLVLLIYLILQLISRREYLSAPSPTPTPTPSPTPIAQPVFVEKTVSTDVDGFYSEIIEPGYSVVNVYSLSPDVIVTYHVSSNTLTIRTYATSTSTDQGKWSSEGSDILHYHDLKPVPASVKIIYLVS